MLSFGPVWGRKTALSVEFPSCLVQAGPCRHQGLAGSYFASHLAAMHSAKDSAVAPSAAMADGDATQLAIPPVPTLISTVGVPGAEGSLGDVVRRLRLLKDIRALINRKGFSANLKVLNTATSDDFMEAKTALRALPLSTSDVPGTEGRKTTRRFDGHNNNLLFSAATFLNTPNFADTYNPLILQLHEGPGKHSHLSISSASQPAVSDTAQEITRAEPRVLSLERMHQIIAEDPRARNDFFLLMTELQYRYIVALEPLHVGRLTLARPTAVTDDDVAYSLQASVALGTIDTQTPFEGQGRGSGHNHGKSVPVSANAPSEDATQLFDCIPAVR